MSGPKSGPKDSQARPGVHLSLNWIRCWIPIGMYLSGLWAFFQKICWDKPRTLFKTSRNSCKKIHTTSGIGWVCTELEQKLTVTSAYSFLTKRVLANSADCYRTSWLRTPIQYTCILHIPNTNSPPRFVLLSAHTSVFVI
jgi:hypothetical protein